MGKAGRQKGKGLCAFALVLLCSGKVLGGQEHGAHAVKGTLGTVEFPVPCNTEAQESTTRGVTLLHSFTYTDFAEAFRDAPTRDPRCAKAHGGLAMAEYHQLWEPYAGTAELKRGSAEIQKARELKSDAGRFPYKSSNIIEIQELRLQSRGKVEVIARLPD